MRSHRNPNHSPNSDPRTTTRRSSKGRAAATRFGPGQTQKDGMCGRVGVKGSTAPKKSKRAQTSKTQAKPRPRPITTWKENANHYDEAAASSDEDGEGPEGQQGSRKGRGGRGQHRALADQHAQTAKPQPQNPSPKPRTTTQTKSKGPRCQRGRGSDLGTQTHGWHMSG